jgi:pimeloyl-ACP methyl ester carboxylesterase
MLAFTAELGAQPERYELGRRLRVFEALWEKTPGEDARKRTVAPLNQAVISFFTFRFGAAGNAIDQARFALDDATKPTPADRWAQSLAIFPAKRLVDTETQELALELKAFYEAPKPADTEFTLRLTQVVNGKDAPAQSMPITELPMTCRFSLKGMKEGDHWLRYEILQKNDSLAKGVMQISVVNKLADCVARLKKIKGDGPELATERATLLATLRLVDKLMQGKTEETDYPVARLLREAEFVGESIRERKPFYDQKRTGEYWLSLAVRPDSKSSGPLFPLRVLIPDKWNEQSPPPLVVALHGAGGSENMFFDGYGNGKIVRLCRERGWMLVAPRVGFNLPMADVLDELHKRWPFDQQCVFIVGHSMGAAQALQAVSVEPKRYAGVVALGGSGTVKATEDLKNVPFFIGVGSQDFALSGARGLRDRLGKAGVARVTFRELANVEHLGVVQQALPESFVFFDEIVKTRRGK